MAASLTTIAITIRKTIRYGLYLVILVTVVRLLYGIGIGFYRKIRPAPPPPPTLAFGKLPKLPFPEQGVLPPGAQELPALEYKVETATGNLPKFDPQVKIYFMPTQSPNLFSANKAKETATRLGFTGGPVELTQTLFRFKHSSSPSSMELNIVTGVFSISFDIASDRSITTFRPPAPPAAINQVKAFLSFAGVFPPDFTEAPATHDFLILEGQKLVPAVSLSEAQIIKVNLYRKEYDKLPSVTTVPDQANVWFLVSGSGDRGRSVFAGEFHYFPVDEEKNATYPLKTSQQALDELIQGGGFIARLGENQDGKITVRKIYLGYYDSGIQMDFYQPVVVFEGDRDFVAYVPAVTHDHYED
ncbi:hypothetical protein HY008_02025 [Candidatus Woesebacteria bacterium]|nr:hypothetical protein [Candidatus Woesebacteria bacterium]